MLEGHAVKLCYWKCIIQGLSFSLDENKYTGYKHANSSFDKQVYE